MKKRATTSRLRPTITGTGLVALDVVCNAQPQCVPAFFAGGTCGNVLTILSYLGWRAMPISRLSQGIPAERLVADLHQWNVDTSFVTMTDDGSTPVIFHRIGRRANGEPFHSFSWRCPECGHYLPGYKPITGAAAEALTAKLPGSQAFFFDRVSRGSLTLANEAAKHGAVVVFEPSGLGDPALFREAWSIAHIVKYSHDRLRDIADLGLKASDKENVLLEIETLGADGLRYRSHLPEARTRRWQSLGALRADGLRDAAGSGDWCTAGILSKLARSGVKGLRKTSSKSLLGAIRFGQAAAAWNCAFEGARGGMYRFDERTFQVHVKAILGSKSILPDDDAHATDARQQLAHVCPACHDAGVPLHGRRKTGVA
jgi:fructokinase